MPSILKFQPPAASNCSQVKDAIVVRLAHHARDRIGGCTTSQIRTQENATKVERSIACLGQNISHNFPMNVGQTEVATLMAEC